ncbi:MAG: hypothetical protein LBR70_00555 [Lactobacillaceae bacterium]|jgi:hypothetical protein|nr:hypothetical protein [Lactobacillaceae bacterium]
MLIKLKVKFMGYLRQRKNERRTDIILKGILFVMFALIAASFYGGSEGMFYYINALRFHYYLIIFVTLIYCLYRRFFMYSFFFVLLLVFSFVSIGYSSGVLFNMTKKDGREISLLYVNAVDSSNYDDVLSRAKSLDTDFVAVNGQRKQEGSETVNMILGNADALREGIIRLSNNYNSYFAVFDIDNKEVVLVSVDFSGISMKEAKIVYANLAEFVNLQENPVIVFGDFGLSAWNKRLINFTNSTNLEVKNRIILTDGKYRFNIFDIPTINVLGYKNMGLEKVSFLPKGHNAKHPILFKLVF